jgi:uncharacterized protein
MFYELEDAMKTCAGILCFVLTSALVPAQNHSQNPAAARSPLQTQPAASSSANPKTSNSAKEADIRRLLDLTGVKAVALQVMDEMEKNLRPVLNNSFPPGDYRDKLIDLFLARVHAKADTQHFLDLAVPVYDKYYSHEEIKGLIHFYETPLGQKTVSVLPKVVADLQQEGQKWGEGIGRDAMTEVLAENPDLAKALDEAGKSAQPK